MLPLIISGPTASGKSSLAIRLAKELSAEIINCDSVQLYKGFDIGSAKPTISEMEGVTHHLLDVFEGGTDCNAFTYVELLHKKLEEFKERKVQPIIVGGSTLYIKAFLEGLVEIEGDVKEVRKNLEKLDTDSLYKQLEDKDSKRASEVHKNDRYRIIRALELIEISNGDVSSLYQQQSAKRTPALILVPCHEREVLYKRINKRSEMMLERGLIEEVEYLLETLARETPVFKSLGYAQVIAFLQGELKKKELSEAIAMNTRRYAKRQITFWRNEPQKVGWDVLSAEKKLDGLHVSCFEFAELLTFVSEYVSSNHHLKTGVLFLDASHL